jgi:hypothetical protein
VTTATPYTLATTEDESGTVHPAEALWTPTPEDAVKAGFIAHGGLVVIGVGDEDEPPSEFVALGHGHTWRALWLAATAYMLSVHGVPDLYPDPDTKQPVPAPNRPQIPKRLHAVFIRHPRPDEPCACEWDGTWRLVYVAAGEPGAVEVTVMRNPAVTA